MFRALLFPHHLLKETNRWGGGIGGGDRQGGIGNTSLEYYLFKHGQRRDYNFLWNSRLYDEQCLTNVTITGKEYLTNKQTKILNLDNNYENNWFKQLIYEELIKLKKNNLVIFWHFVISRATVSCRFLRFVKPPRWHCTAALNAL